MPLRHDEAARTGPLLSAEALVCRRGGRQVFAGLSFELVPGQLLELRGANGSGKSSLLRMLAGLTPVAGGRLCMEGRALRPADLELARCAAYLGHSNALSADLSATESLELAQRLDAAAVPPSIADTLQTWGLAAQARQPVRLLSQGQRRRLALARLWRAQRRLWLLDEPCAGLDAAGEQLVAQRLAAHLAEGGAAVVATHQALALPRVAVVPIDLDALPPSRSTDSAWGGLALAAC